MLVHVISLERLPERRRRAVETLTSLGVRYQIFPAIDGRISGHALFSHYDEDKCLRYFGAPLRPGEIGCYASHYSLWRKCVDEGVPITVLEEDVDIRPEFPKALELASARIAAMGFIRLSGLVDRKYRILEEIDGNWRLVRFLRGTQGGQCYCISPEGAAALLKAADFWVDPVDLYLDRFWRHGVKYAGLLPFTVSHQDGDSAIGTRSYERTGINKWRREIWRMSDRVVRLAYNLRHPRS